MLREDRDFHTIQDLEAAVRQYSMLPREAGANSMISTARYLAAHSPTVRAQGQTYQIALRLNRGEHVFDEAIGGTQMNAADYSALDETLEIMAPMGPDLSNGFPIMRQWRSKRCARWSRRRCDAVVRDYRHSLAPRRARVARLTNDNWRAALGDHRRTEDWFEFFRNELEERQWPGCWTPGLRGSVRV